MDYDEFYSYVCLRYRCGEFNVSKRGLTNPSSYSSVWAKDGFALYTESSAVGTILTNIPNVEYISSCNLTQEEDDYDLIITLDIDGNVTEYSFQELGDRFNLWACR